ncbi:DUF493 family protein [Buchnera aphidicola (Thelaxes californica)]|uniref:UPF0250 protein D9V80_01915 n=1 Tax=Buchnera aphidicola (Thelaxes californica) TaxID=1315998 RepID=A0A4D6YAM8_9GAMM|nr:DUF493 family protein YbeD [Buchnera aphidicola]QCI26897.1 DUF493 family protein [Buchnera aphidicola (Thelaxes californica)]
MKNKLENLLQFPCSFTYKVIGLAHPELINNVIKRIQIYIPGDYTPVIKSSNKGNYISIAVTVFAKNFYEIENLYLELSKINMVKIVL